MGTRATVTFQKNGKSFLNVYHQFDGYIGGVGEELIAFLESKKLVNGIGSEVNKSKIANGAGCLAAQYIVAVKKAVGGVYITNLESKEEWHYVVNVIMNYKKELTSFVIEVNIENNEIYLAPTPLENVRRALKFIQNVTRE